MNTLHLKSPPSGPELSGAEGDFAFQCRAKQLPRMEQQFKFARGLGRDFRADFCFVQYRLIVEIQGGIWRKGGGAHSHPIDLERDIERCQYMAFLGFWFLPFTPQQVKDKTAIVWTQKVLYRLGWRPS